MDIKHLIDKGYSYDVAVSKKVHDEIGHKYTIVAERHKIEAQFTAPGAEIVFFTVSLGIPWDAKLKTIEDFFENVWQTQSRDYFERF